MEPATTIIRQLGGATAVSKLLGLHRTQVSRWRLARSAGGTDGRVPQGHHRAILDAAAARELDLTATDLLPARASVGAAA